MQISCGFPPGLQTVEHIQLAEQLGYERAWLYDSPGIYLDIFTVLGMVAVQTDRIGLGTAVLVPSTRSVFATAASIAAIEGAAPGRLAIALGTGATARWVFGKNALTMKETGDYVRQLRALLRGEVVEVDGEMTQMCQLPQFAPPRPIDVPILFSGLGPKGQALTRELCDGVMTVGYAAGGFDWSAQLVPGTVLDPGEALTSERVKASAGPWYAIMAHGAWESNHEAVDGFPGGAEWRKELESRRPPREQHLLVHEGHASTVTDFDRTLVDAAGEGITGIGWVAEADGIRSKIKDAEAAGATEIIFAPAGPDLPRELRAFAEAAGL